MGDLLQQFSILQLAIMSYMVLAIIKIVLVLSNVRIAAGAMQRKMGSQHSLWYYIGLTGALCTAYTFFMVVPLLWRERFKFFIAYTDKKVMRDVISGL